MTLSPPNLVKLLAPLAVFAVLVVALALVNQDARTGGLGGGSSVDVRSYAALGETFLARARETGDPSHYGRAERAFDAALRREPGNLGALIGVGTLANLRHDFAAGLRLGLRARRAAPSLVDPYVVLADAQVELGRYDAAASSIQRLLDLKPGLPAYARASYYRELSGDRTGAIEAMRLAASAGGTAESIAYVQTLIGDLELARGRAGAARLAYRAALAAVTNYPQGLAGLARVALAGGDLGRAAARLRRSTTRLPLTTNLTLLAETELAAGDRAAAGSTLDVARAQQRLLRAGGAIPDAENVLFEANHGSPTRAVALGQQVWRAAPSVRSADALGWALTRAGHPREGLPWSRRALKLGSRDPLFRYHAGIAARRAGRMKEAATNLRLAAVGRGMLAPRDARRALELTT